MCRTTYSRAPLTRISFLPYTIAFHDHPANDDEPSHSPPTAAARQSRRASAIELGQKRGSQVSLLAGPTTPQTPAAALTDDFFASKFGPESQKLLFARPGDPRSVVHSDAHVPDWGEQAVFNQPRSRAGPLPSNSILDFAKAQDELIEQKRRQQQRRKQLSSPPSRSSRNQSRAQSHDRGYEGKPWTVEPAIHQNGGLTNAIRSASNEEGVGTTWIGTVGFPTDSLSQNLKEDIDDKLLNEHESVVVYVSEGRRGEGRFSEEATAWIEKCWRQLRSEADNVMLFKQAQPSSSHKHAPQTNFVVNHGILLHKSSCWSAFKLSSSPTLPEPCSKRLAI